jgi:uncharacterized protein (TIGR03067 family)
MVTPIAFLLFVPLAGAGDAKKELEALQGKWEIAEVTPAASKVIFKDMTVVIQKDKMSWRKGDMVSKEDTIKLEPGKTPKAMDLIRLKGNPVGKVSQSIYKLEGDTLTLCTPILPEVSPRPTEFKGGEPSKAWLLVLKRVK